MRIWEALPARASNLRKGVGRGQLRTKTEIYAMGRILSGISPSEYRPALTRVLPMIFTADAPIQPMPSLPVDEAIASSPEHFLDYDWRFSKASRHAIVDFVRCQPGVRRVAYLGCPTVAIVHAAGDAKGYDDILLIDRGHPGIFAWIGAGLLHASQYLALDLMKPVPMLFPEPFDAVIVDPPWYEQEYRAFATFAANLVRTGGLIGISLLPAAGPYKSDKRLRFQEMLKASLAVGAGGGSHCRSLHVSYTCPSFESSWGGDQAFTDRERHEYRPATMEFFQVRARAAAPIATRRIISTSRPLPRVVLRGDGHYLRTPARMPQYPFRIALETHRNLSHVDQTSTDIVAWSTGNTVVRRAAAGHLVLTDDHILRLVAEHERHLPIASALPICV
jgi:hypothetical protein